MSEKISVTLSPDRLQVGPGESVETTVTIKNASDVVEAYSVVIEGIDAEWCTLSVSSLSLFPGDQEQVSLTIQPPKTTAGKAGTYNVIIKVASRRDATIESTAQLALEVGRFLVFDLDLSPKKARGRKGSYRVIITNSGNVPTTYTLSGEDAEDMCRFEFKSQAVQVEPGATVEVPLVVNPKKKPFTGKAKAYGFKITVTPHASEAGEGKSVEGQLECKPLIPVWALGVGGLAVGAIIAVVVVLSMAGGGNAPVITSVTPDPATVGLGGTSNISCVATDPDGDTLSYAWDAQSGTITGSGDTITWQAPGAAGTYAINVTVDDGTGRAADGSTVVSVVVTTGTIDIKSNPAGAAVYLDGVDTGSITPYIIANVGEGQHTIKLTYNHYKYREETVNVTAGETTYVNWALIWADTTTVTIQPNPTAAKDAYLWSPSPDSNLGDFQYLCVGLSALNQIARSYLQFDLSSIPSTAVIGWAYIGIYYYSGSSAVATPIGIYEVTATWSESTITWNDQPTSAATAEYTYTMPASPINTFYTWSIKDLVQGWIDGSITNYGVLLKDTNESTVEAWKCFYSSDWGNADQRPKLTISYYDPTP